MVNYYTQMFFPENGINFIIIADNTVITANSTYDFMLTIKSEINEIYPAEVSQKVRQAFKAKSLNGEFLHPSTPYGYIKSTTLRNHLVIDEKMHRLSEIYLKWSHIKEWVCIKYPNTFLSIKY